MSKVVPAETLAQQHTRMAKPGTAESNRWPAAKDSDSETNEPWKPPGQSSRQPEQLPPPKRDPERAAPRLDQAPASWIWDRTAIGGRDGRASVLQ